MDCRCRFLRINMFRFFAIGCLTVLLTACGHNKPNSVILGHSPSQGLSLIPSEFSKIHSWQYNNFQNSLIAFQKSCNQIPKYRHTTALGKHPLFGHDSDWQAVCNKAHRESPNNAKQFFEQEFQPVLVSNHDAGLFTGYYIPELRGSLTQSSLYQYPLYERPAGGNLPSRASIVSGALNGRAKPILWVDSDIDSFFLHIQGSGNVRLPDNSMVHVAYAGQNGHQYYAIGKYLIEQNFIPREKMSAQAIKQWLLDNPTQAQMVMNKNPSYVFFKLDSQNNTGQAKGAAGVPLTPEYSLAVDNEYYPYGLPMWIETGVQVPVNGYLKNMAFERLMIAQDTGGAIKGAVRGDIFFGTGKNAETMAGKQSFNGRKYLLLPRRAIASNI
jgi:membrane-bound lytic murein transglycosylase A